MNSTVYKTLHENDGLPEVMRPTNRELKATIKQRLTRNKKNAIAKASRKRNRP